MFNKLFGSSNKSPKTDFSKFFVGSKAAEKKKVIKEVVRKANGDQKKLFDT